MLMMLHRIYQNYEAEYYEDGKKYYSGYSLHRDGPPYLSVYCNSDYEENSSKANFNKFQEHRDLKSEICDKYPYYQKFKYIKESFCNIFLLFFGEFHNIYQRQVYHSIEKLSRKDGSENERGLTFNLSRRVVWIYPDDASGKAGKRD